MSDDAVLLPIKRTDSACRAWRLAVIRRTSDLAAVVSILLSGGRSPVLASDHVNLEGGIPTTLEDINPIERRSAEFQAFGRYFRRAWSGNAGEAEPRLVWGPFENVQFELATPLLLRRARENGNGDVRIGLLHQFRTDRAGDWTPGFALAGDVTLPSGLVERGYTNRADAGLTVIMKKDAGPHSFHLNVGFDWTRDESQEEDLRRFSATVVVGHDTPLTRRLILVSDVVWHPADAKGTADVWLVETGARAQMSHSIIGAIGMGIGLNRGEDTPAFSVTAGIQLSL